MIKNFILDMWKQFPNAWRISLKPGFGAFISFLQFFYLYQVFVKNDMGGLSFSLASLFAVVLSLLSVRIFFQSILALTPNSKWASAGASILFMTLFGLLAAYQFKAHQLPTWSLMSENIANIMSLASLEVVLQNLDTGALAYILIFSVISCLFEWRRGSISALRFSKPKLPKTLLLFFIYGLLLLYPYESEDPFIRFFRSGIAHYFPKTQIAITLPPNTYPLLQGSNFNTMDFGSKRPDIFIIVCESLNYSALDARTDGGVAWTPFLNTLRDNSVYITPFYGNSIQTAKGHFAILFGTTPSLTGKTYTTYPDVRIPSIGNVLQEFGYKTVYFGAHNSRDFDNFEGFLSARGFDFHIAHDYLTDAEKRNGVSKWGPYDDVFFDAFFRFYKTEKAKSNQPLLMVITTISTHFPFNHLDSSRRILHPDPQSFRENYANSIHHTDRGLARFFDHMQTIGFDDSKLVIITGDHAYPMGAHGNYHLEAGYHEDSYRIPFFLVWPGMLSPQKLTTARSQIDIAPTILDLLDIPTRRIQFQGRSIFDTQPSYIPQVQSYGKQFGLIQYPLKYRYSERLNKEYVYHLENDPMETNNIIDTLSEVQIAAFRAELHRMYLTQKTLETNQVHP